MPRIQLNATLVLEVHFNTTNFSYFHFLKKRCPILDDPRAPNQNKPSAVISKRLNLNLLLVVALSISIIRATKSRRLCLLQSLRAILSGNT